MPHYGNKVPEGWRWCRLSDIAYFGGGKTPSTENKEYWDGEYLWVTSKDMKHDVINNSILKVSEKGKEELELYPPKTILIVVRSGILRRTLPIAILESSATINQDLKAICPYNPALSNYIYYYLKANEDYILENYQKDGTTVESINFDKFQNIEISIPPFAEQIRIIAEVDKWFTLINIIETGKTDLQIAIQQAKSKILDLAIHGKLVPQYPNDEPASELLKRIHPEAEITCDNAHSRKLPVNWTSCKLSDLCIFLSRGKSPEYSDVRKYPVFAQKCNLKEGGISIEKARFLAPATLNKWPDIYQLQEDDILINSTGTGTVGRVGFFKLSYLGSFPLIMPDSHVSVVRTFKEINSRYIYLLLKTQACQTYFEDNLAGSTNQKELYISVIANTEISLPPVEEQKRIVAKVEELFNYLDHIETALKIQSPFCHTEHREVSPANFK